MLDSAEQDDLIALLKTRFEQNMRRHPGFSWQEVEKALRSKVSALQTVAIMEQTGGEPDVVVLAANRALTFVDCAAETPSGRRSLCFDEAALAARKENKPKGSAEGLASSMGLTMLNEDQYRALQQHGAFDLKTSSWIATPAELRGKGGALFGDCRYGRVFIYHNGAESYYAARGFRGFVTL
jgi:predicted type IV restriction endonuclease